MSSSFFGPNNASGKFQKLIDILENDQVSKEFTDYLQSGGDLP
jgi:translation initiation factor IF-1